MSLHPMGTVKLNIIANFNFMCFLDHGIDDNSTKITTSVVIIKTYLHLPRRVSRFALDYHLSLAASLIAFAPDERMKSMILRFPVAISTLAEILGGFPICDHGLFFELSRILAILCEP
jgi:hypothetical protein